MLSDNLNNIFVEIAIKSGEESRQKGAYLFLEKIAIPVGEEGFISDVKKRQSNVISAESAENNRIFRSAIRQVMYLIKDNDKKSDKLLEIEARGYLCVHAAEILLNRSEEALTELKTVIDSISVSESGFYKFKKYDFTICSKHEQVQKLVEEVVKPFPSGNANISTLHANKQYRVTAKDVKATGLEHLQELARSFISLQR